jgi:hypothetical protein
MYIKRWWAIIPVSDRIPILSLTAFLKCCPSNKGVVLALEGVGTKHTCCTLPRQDSIARIEQACGHVLSWAPFLCIIHHLECKFCFLKLAGNQIIILAPRLSPEQLETKPVKPAAVPFVWHLWSKVHGYDTRAVWNGFRTWKSFQRMMNTIEFRLILVCFFEMGSLSPASASTIGMS